MKFKSTDIRKIERFFNHVRKDVYPESPTITHSEITQKMFDYFITRYHLLPNSRILDVGCGQGVAFELFVRKGFSPVGITLNSEDFSLCKQKGYDVHKMDQSFLDFDDQEIDFIWCRHCLEHSVMPMFTLMELFRVLKNKGYLYIEVPAPDTCCHHQSNKNHYSVFGKSMWAELIKRAGFHILEILDIDHTVPAGLDTYWVFIQMKP